MLPCILYPLWPFRLFSFNAIKRLLTSLMLSALLGASLPASAVSVEPAAQQQQQAREQERELRQQQESVPDVQLQPPPSPELLQRLPTDETPCFKIERLQLQGEAAQQFQWALAAAHRVGGSSDSPLGRRLGVNGINLILKRVHNAIVQRGFITTRVGAEPQNLACGTLVLTLIPGRLHHVYFSEKSDQQARHWNALPAKPGALLNLRDIEQALENFKRLPSVTATFQIAPASDLSAPEGSSDLIITWQQRFPLRGTLSLDNAGSESTGQREGGATLAYDQPLGLKELFYINGRQDLGGGKAGKRGSGEAGKRGSAGPKGIRCSMPYPGATGCLTPPIAKIDCRLRRPSPRCTAAAARTLLGSSPDCSIAMPAVKLPWRSRAFIEPFWAAVMG